MALPFSGIVLVGWVFVAGLSLAAACRGYSLGAVHGLLIAVVSLVAEHGLRQAGFSSCGT